MAIGTVGPIKVVSTFDQVLILDPSTSGAGWTLVGSGFKFDNPTMAIIPGGIVNLTSWNPLGATADIPGLSYTNPTGDVRGISGLPVLPFANFPVS